MPSGVYKHKLHSKEWIRKARINAKENPNYGMIGVVENKKSFEQDYADRRSKKT